MVLCVTLYDNCFPSLSLSPTVSHCLSVSPSLSPSLSFSSFRNHSLAPRKPWRTETEADTAASLAALNVPAAVDWVAEVRAKPSHSR